MSRQKTKISTRLSKPKILIVTILVFVAAVARINVAHSEESHVEQTNSVKIIDPKDLEKFFDGFFSQAMDQYHVPGVAIAFVQNGQMTLSKGYGYADLQQGVPVDPETTRFPVGSVTKLFTATAVLQLKQSNKLNLDSPVNLFVDEVHSWPFGNEVSIRNLLTHTGGIAQRYVHIANRKPRACLSLDEFISADLPNQVEQSNQHYIYSNEGYAILGYIVQVASGESFDTYITNHILSPLGMYRSYILPGKIASGNIATGYGYRYGIYAPRSLDCINATPAGGLASTANDMAMFLIFQLGQLAKGNRILDAYVLQEMQSQQFTNDPRIPGMTFGFREAHENGLRMLWHSGRTNGFRSLLVLIPSNKIGLFVVYNTDSDGSQLHRELLTQFLDRYYPSPEYPCPENMPLTEYESFIGYYRNVGLPQHGLEKLISLRQILVKKDTSGDYLNVSYIGDATLSHSKVSKTKWCPVGNLFLVREDGNRRLVFQRSSNKAVSYLFIQTDTGPEVFIKIPWIQSYTFQIAFFLSVVIVLASSLRFVVRKFWLQIKEKGSIVLLLLLSGINLIIIIGWLLIVFLVEEYELTYGLPNVVKLWLCMPILSLSLSPGLLFVAIKSWLDLRWTSVIRLHFSIVTLFNMTLIFWLWHWGLFG